jgi:hypothetical protein
MPKLIPSKMIKIPRLMEVGEYRDRRFAGDKPSLQQLKKMDTRRHHRRRTERQYVLRRSAVRAFKLA